MGRVWNPGPTGHRGPTGERGALGTCFFFPFLVYTPPPPRTLYSGSEGPGEGNTEGEDGLVPVTILGLGKGRVSTGEVMERKGRDRGSGSSHPP